MNFDFQAAMVIALFLTGTIWGVYAFLYAPRRRAEIESIKRNTQGDQNKKRLERLSKEPVLVEYARSFFPIILIVLLLRSFLVEPFRIPSGSMMPTLLVGDFILVNKYTYGIRLPILGTKIIDIEGPSRGDVVVFRFPVDPSKDYIKRVIGLPGDRVSYRNKTVYIDGEMIKQDALGPYTDDSTGLQADVDLRLEHLGDADHEILIHTKKRFPAGGGELIVPDGHYFVMGDNRDNSNDSRFWGTVPEENLVGKAFMIWMHWNSWERIGSSID